MIAILGAGIAGISAGYHLGLKDKKTIIFEKNNSWGGLCDNFTIDGFRFDNSIHLSFSKSTYVNELFSKSSDYYTYDPCIGNYYKGHWLNHPAQNNLFRLDIEDRIKIIKDFLYKDKIINKNKINNYEQWLRFQYGNYFAENFPMRYTRKYWTVNSKDLKTSWIENRMYIPSMEEVLRGAMSEDTENVYYTGKMRYPKKGGYKSFLQYMARRCNIRYNRKVAMIDTKKKMLEFENGTTEYYEYLISSLPLPVIIKLIKDVPKKITESANNLNWTSLALVSLGFRKPDITKYLWFYIYDEDFLPSRVYSPNLKSVENVPEGCSSLQYEVYFSKKKKLKIKSNDLIEHIVTKSSKIGIFEKNNIVVLDYRELDFGNVIFDKNIDINRKIVHEYLDDIGINYMGRFGEWAYFFSDESLLSGKKVAERLFNE